LSEKEENDATKEQIRGLYIVGLLAVLVAYKLSSKLDPSADSFFSVVIMFWVGYSFCMIFGYSTMQNPLFTVSTSTSKRFASFLREMGQLLLLMSLGASILFFIWYSWAFLLLVVIALGIGAAVYYPARALRKRLKKNKKEKSEPKN
jgi:hypothetical protein